MNNKFDFYTEDWSYSEPAKKYFSDLIKNQYVIIIEIDNCSVGYLAGSICKDDSSSYYEGITAELESMFIKEEYRKLGLGSKLIQIFTDYCKKNGAKRIVVTASFGNVNAINCYKKNGFGNYNISLRKEL